MGADADAHTLTSLSSVPIDCTSHAARFGLNPVSKARLGVEPRIILSEPFALTCTGNLPGQVSFTG